MTPSRSTTWPTVSNRPSFPAMEGEVLARWRDRDVFARSLELRADAPVWTFYEGPPTANGRPGTHHVEARTFKDVFPRYQTMKGRYVRRKGGWDCHGLPVELEIERELGLDSKADIEAYGIEAFNRRCRDSVTRYVGEWSELTERIGFWVDLDDAYWTMDTAYVESLWWGLKQLWDQDLIFEDFRVTPYCGRCGTGLSDAEVAQGYQTVEDPSVYVRFPVLEGPLADEGASLVVWTTTPWTLPSNTAVAVGRDISYELVRADGDLLVIAGDLRERVLGEEAEVVRGLTADELLGLHYEAPFTLVEVEADHRYVVAADFVTTSDGSGLVHLAPAFGADDMEVGRREGLPVINPVDLEGRFTTGPFAGDFVKDADPAIIEALRVSGRLLKDEVYEHTYPFCWRCKRPLIYYAKPSWYIRTTARRDELLANNRDIDWHPDHIREGRFGNWLENNVDWALSRDRYWGTPLPFWRCDDCDHVTVVGSRAELGELAGRDLSELDPHRPYVDEVVVPCPACGADSHRVAHVADAWFDSGGMPYAQWGYPHQGHDEFERHFPADFICEAIDQTRGWFYTLLAESTLLFDRSSYETVLCLGHIVDEDGAKMSKSKGNILDPWELIDRHGADAMRWLMLAEGNPWVNRRVGHQSLEDVVRRFLLTLWNVHAFFTTYAGIDGFRLDAEVAAVADRPATDRWVLAELADAVTVVDEALGTYDVSTACRRIERFVDDLSNWYVRRNRRRFWKNVADDPADKGAAYATLHTCLVTLSQLLAPFTPFLADRLWEDLVRSQDPDATDSVHLTDFPVALDEWRDEDLRRAMATTRRIVELGRQARNESGVKVRQPLARALVTVPADERAGLEQFLDDVADELNVRTVEQSSGTGDLVDRSLKPNFRALGPAFQGDAPQVAGAISRADAGEAERIADALATDGRADIEVDGRTVELTADMVEIVETPRTGWELARDGATSFALDTALTRELRVEGAAREIVRALNDQRKNLELALDDRIEVAVHATPAELDAELADAGWYAVVAREVLATDLHRRPERDAVEVDLGDLGTVSVAVVAT
ncbi:MAG: isoleucine--tRNA ligase [Actinobacteria bacterium]|nr:isoleucine--tRNA ligase [Actinomycetota bacterium]